MELFTDTSHEAEFRELLERVEDRPGLEAIKALHQQLDDDQDGTIEPSETGDFIKADLKVSLHDSFTGSHVITTATSFLNPTQSDMNLKKKVFPYESTRSCENEL